MKAALISPYSPRKVTGVGTSIIDLCTKYREEDIGFFLAVPAITEKLPLDPAFKVRSNYFEAPNPDVSFMQNLRVILYNNKLLRKNRHNIDLVHIFSIKSTTAAAAVFSRILNKPLVSTIYIMPPQPKNPVKRFFFNIATGMILKLTDNFAYETHVAQKQCGHRPGVIIPEGIDVEHFSPDKKIRRQVRSRLKIGEDKFVLLYAGRLVESKGIVELLTAVSALPDKVLEKLVLLVIGNVESKGITKALKKVKNEKWLIHKPPVARNAIKSYYCAADAFVLPSYYEGISSSLIESMACGLPPIVTAVGGNVEVVEHERNGLLVEVRDAGALRDSIRSMYDDSKLRLRLAGAARATVVKKFSLSKKARSYIQLYNDVMSR